jgi:hypothetical protein
MYAGRSRRAAATAVRISLFAYWYTDSFLFIGRHHTRVKEEPASPAKPTAKRKAYSTSGSNAIGTIQLFDEADNPQSGSKRQKTSAGGTTQVRFDDATGTGSTRPPRPTRKSTRGAKAGPKVEGNSKVEMDELFERLGQEFHAIARTCETIAEMINANA